MTTEQFTLYRHFGVDNDLLYIGRTNNWMSRKAKVGKGSILLALKKGRFSVFLAIRLERALGRDVIKAEELSHLLVRGDECPILPGC